MSRATPDMDNLERENPMNTITKTLHRFHSNEDGATATEYLVLLTLVACFLILAVKHFGAVLEHKYANANNAVNRRVTF